MIHAFSDMNVFELFFLICAVVGGFFVVARLVLQFVGAVDDFDTAGEIDLDVDAEHTDSDVGFKLLSMHSLTSFLMMFGLVGLALYRQSGVGFIFSIFGATLAGLFSVWIISRLFALFSGMQSSGTLKTAESVGSTGTVYMTIPEGGTGRVTINFKNRLREFDASAVGGASLETGAVVKVVQVNGNILVVERVS